MSKPQHSDHSSHHEVLRYFTSMIRLETRKVRLLTRYWQGKDGTLGERCPVWFDLLVLSYRRRPRQPCTGSGVSEPDIWATISGSAPWTHWPFYEKHYDSNLHSELESEILPAGLFYCSSQLAAHQFGILRKYFQNIQKNAKLHWKIIQLSAIKSPLYSNCRLLEHYIVKQPTPWP